MLRREEYTLLKLEIGCYSTHYEPNDVESVYKQVSGELCLTSERFNY